MKIWVDGSLILDKWFDQASAYYTVARNISAGEHLMQVDYYENGGQAVAQVSWD